MSDTPSTCECGDFFGVDHAMVCRHGGFIFQRHDGLRDLEAEMLNKVCNDVQIEPVLQEISGEELTPSANKAADARLHIRARGFWERQGSAFLDVRCVRSKYKRSVHPLVFLRFLLDILMYFSAF